MNFLSLSSPSHDLKSCWAISSPACSARALCARVRVCICVWLGVWGGCGEDFEGVEASRRVTHAIGQSQRMRSIVRRRAAVRRDPARAASPPLPPHLVRHEAVLREDVVVVGGHGVADLLLDLLEVRSADDAHRDHLAQLLHEREHLGRRLAARLAQRAVDVEERDALAARHRGPRLAAVARCRRRGEGWRGRGTRARKAEEREAGARRTRVHRGVAGTPRAAVRQHPEAPVWDTHHTAPPQDARVRHTWQVGEQMASIGTLFGIWDGVRGGARRARARARRGRERILGSWSGRRSAGRRSAISRTLHRRAVLHTLKKKGSGNCPTRTHPRGALVR